MVVSPTLAVNEEIARRRAAGLTTVPLGFGEASIPIHPELVERLRRHAHRGDYGPVAGAPQLREAAAGYWSRRGVSTSPDQVLAGPGSKPLLYAIFQALGGPVLLPKPSWVSYAAQNLLGHEAPMVAVPPGQGGVPDPGRLAHRCRPVPTAVRRSGGQSTDRGQRNLVGARATATARRGLGADRATGAAGAHHREPCPPWARGTDRR
jgi:aspartate/methionine/tyrosine aminotransferase